MAVNKTQVVRKAAAIGATLEITATEATATAPAGKTIDGLHFSNYEFAAFESKIDVWTMLLNELRTLADCNCGCADEPTQTIEGNQ